MHTSFVSTGFHWITLGALPAWERPGGRAPVSSALCSALTPCQAVTPPLPWGWGRAGERGHVGNVSGGPDTRIETTVTPQSLSWAVFLPRACHPGTLPQAGQLVRESSVVSQPDGSKHQILSPAPNPGSVGRKEAWVFILLKLLVVHPALGDFKAESECRWDASSMAQKVSNVAVPICPARNLWNGTQPSGLRAARPDTWHLSRTRGSAFTEFLVIKNFMGLACGVHCSSMLRENVGWNLMRIIWIHKGT